MSRERAYIIEEAEDKFYEAINHMEKRGFSKLCAPSKLCVNDSTVPDVMFQMMIKEDDGE